MFHLHAAVGPENLIYYNARNLEPLIAAAIALIFTLACSKPKPWTLWLHSYSLQGEILDQVNDKWMSFDTYPTVAECRSTIEPQLAILEKAQREDRQSGLADALKLRLPERNVSVKREEFGLTVTSTSVKHSGGADTVTEMFTFFCLPLGKDPR